jgi:hypothetical protein
LEKNPRYSLPDPMIHASGQKQPRERASLNAAQGSLPMLEFITRRTAGIRSRKQTVTTSLERTPARFLPWKFGRELQNRKLPQSAAPTASNVQLMIFWSATL